MVTEPPTPNSEEPEKIDEIRLQEGMLRSLFQQKITALEEFNNSLLNQAFSGQLK